MCSVISSSFIIYWIFSVIIGKWKAVIDRFLYFCRRWNICSNWINRLSIKKTMYSHFGKASHFKIHFEWHEKQDNEQKTDFAFPNLNKLRLMQEPKNGHHIFQHNLHDGLYVGSSHTTHTQLLCLIFSYLKTLCILCEIIDEKGCQYNSDDCNVLNVKNFVDFFVWRGEQDYWTQDEIAMITRKTTSC